MNPLEFTDRKQSQELCRLNLTCKECYRYKNGCTLGFSKPKPKYKDMNIFIGNIICGFCHRRGCDQRWFACRRTNEIREMSETIKKEIKSSLKEKDCMECKFFKFADKVTKYIQENLNKEKK